MLIEYEKDFQTLTKKLQVKEVDMGAVVELMARTKAEIALAEKEDKVLKMTNDDLMGLLACSKSEKSRRTSEALLPTVSDPLIGFSFIYERYIAKLSSKKVVEFNPWKKTQT